MPRVYLTPADLAASPLGLTYSDILTNLNPGVVDQLLARASQRVDAFCDRRLQAPLATSVGTGGCASRATSVPLTSTLSLDNKGEWGCILNVGGSTQETCDIVPGSISVTLPWTAPYPGTVTLTAGTTYSHAAGEPVQLVYREVTEALNSSSADPYTEALETQTAQLAFAHLPAIQKGLTRTVWLKQFPVAQPRIYQIEHAFSFAVTYNPIPLQNILMVEAEGLYRFQVGTVITPGGFVRTTYAGGFTTVPEDIQEATLYYAAYSLQLINNPTLATTQKLDTMMLQYNSKSGTHPLIEAAESILCAGHYKRIGW